MINTPLLEQPIGRIVSIPPPVDWIKINSDVSFIKIGEIVYAAVGLVFRDHLDTIKAMHAIPLRGVRDSYEAKLKAVECSLILARQYGFTKILIRLDNSFIVKPIKCGELPVKYYDIYRSTSWYAIVKSSVENIDGKEHLEGKDKKQGVASST
ncbi:hypothetical protein LOK49_LG03G02576 [Camellia lanceoleosa]|uniref:Uncharacterized protein n=1 Tax=Camellia lanceoleosa TaxID=1840588 RepID=A0ACC0I7J2_9ERIC|nr:hypothetical protein LOK49_LG03G02576 [Camellia lanceoleosa]